MKCDKCGSSMSVRTGKFGKFYGCDNYPKCRNIKKYTGSVISLAPVKREPVKLLEGSPEQIDIWSELKDGDSHLVVAAYAGTGKTTTLVQGILRLTPGIKIVVVAFNKHIETEFNNKLQASGITFASARTYHSLGLNAVRAKYPNVKIDNRGDKLDTIINGYVNDDVEPGMHSAVSKLVKLAKNYLIDGTDRLELEELANKHDVEVPNMLRAAEIVPKVLADCKSQTAIVDFDDMVWLPVVLKLPVEQADMLLVDEAQDTNKVQQELAMMACPTGRIVVVGDKYQSIYGFRGADTNALPSLTERLQATKRGVKVMPLTVTRRCPKSHVRLAQSIVPDIQALESAIEGTIETMAPNAAVESMKPGDLVLCRVNKHLVPTCYALIRRGIPAAIRGRDIGSGLISLINKLRPASMTDLLNKLREYEAKEESKLASMGKKGANMLIALQDKCDTLRELCEGIDSVTELKSKIESIFADFEADQITERKKVVFGTVHRTKGLESDTVYVLAPELLPHPMASQDWEVEQESNLAYVAATRSKDSLVFVGKVPPIYGGE